MSKWRKQSVALQGHIDDTIDRLHGHALQIHDAGVQHRRKRVKIYRQKEGPKWAYEGFKELAIRKAKQEFPLASDVFRQRIAESFARRRIRFEYLREHQKKRAVDMIEQEQEQDLSLQPQPEPEGADSPAPAVGAQRAPNKANVAVPVRLQEQHTVYSATVETKLDPRPQPKRPKRAESVASVALGNPGFPPPPKLRGGGFQCPYCWLEFSAREAEKYRWR